jgi:hypothetical protein
MDVKTLEKHFSHMGARVRVVVPRNRYWLSSHRPASRRPAFGIDIQADARGEYFAIEVPPAEDVEIETLEVRPDMRHLLLLVRRPGFRKYLCGYDERHWFVAGVQSASVVSVVSAMEALRPPGLTEVVERRVRVKDRLRRRNEAFVRQGEWFFLPQPQFVAPESLILRHEPLSRGNGGKPHWCEEVYRDGGVPVYVCSQHPTGLSFDDYNDLVKRQPEARHWNWRLMRRDAQVYARGRISHPDHKTVVLPFWHRVLMNDEHRRGVVFLD